MLIQKNLIDLDCQQQPADIETDNSIASRIINKIIKQNKSRLMNMRHFWVIDQQKEKLINVRWKPGNVNLANYCAKNFTAPFRKKVRTIYLHDQNM